MTPEEKIKVAIHCLGFQAEQEVCEECPVYNEGRIACTEVARAALKALKEFQQYQEIGTVEECREAVEKQKPKKTSDIEYDYSHFVCPNCGEWIRAPDDFESHKYCLNCGQALQ